ncbi:VOC family protein [Mesorhizobium sp. NPDC059054]|uniref:VOC family protein n=1 Tax=unclassified Mesorhizobium TaxID=325217 RepID=UPI0006C75AC5|nr:VOC family protein [Mesorhizobium sp. 1M-11]
MIDHTGISVVDFEVAKTFYDKVMAPLGASLLYMVPEQYTGGAKVGGYGRDRPVFWLHETTTPAPGRHYAFTAGSRAAVDAFHQAALLAGGKDNGAPGLRSHYHEHYYAAFAFDPDGNNIEAVCHRPA